MFYRNFMGYVFCILMFDMQKESFSWYATKQFVGGIWKLWSKEIKSKFQIQISPNVKSHLRENHKRQWVSKVAQSCPTLCDPMDCSLPGTSVHGIFQAIVLEWIAISFSRGSSQPRDQTRVSHIVDRHFTIWPTSEEFFLIKDSRTV